MEILQAAESDQEVQAFIENLKTIYSFQQRNIRGTENVSYHSYGLALDLVPISYDRKQRNGYILIGIITRGTHLMTGIVRFNL